MGKKHFTEEQIAFALPLSLSRDRIIRTLRECGQ